MQTEKVRIDGLIGTWRMIAVRHTMDGVFYLWESELYGGHVPAVLTDEHLMLMDDCCESGIDAALMDYDTRVGVICEALSKLSVEQVLQYLTGWHGLQLLDKPFYEYLVDEGILPEYEDEDEGVEYV